MYLSEKASSFVYGICFKTVFQSLNNQDMETCVAQSILLPMLKKVALVNSVP